MPFNSSHIRLSDFIERFLESSQPELHVSGSSSVLPASLLLALGKSETLKNQSHLIILPSQEIAEDFAEAIQFFNPTLAVSVFEPFDVSPYSGLYANPRTLTARVRWLWQVSQPQNRGLYVASVEALQQLTVPAIQILKHALILKTGTDLPSETSRWLNFLGYAPSPRVEDVGQYALRGGILDIFSPAQEWPIRIELFGDTIESMRQFNPETQRTLEVVTTSVILPVREFTIEEKDRELLISNLKAHFVSREKPETEWSPYIQDLALGRHVSGLEFIPSFAGDMVEPLSYLKTVPLIWLIDSVECERQSETHLKLMQNEYRESEDAFVVPEPSRLVKKLDLSRLADHGRVIIFSKLLMTSANEDSATPSVLNYKTQNVSSISNQSDGGTDSVMRVAKEKILSWRRAGFSVLISTHTSSQVQRLTLLLEKEGLKTHRFVPQADEVDPWSSFFDELFDPTADIVGLIDRPLPESAVLTEERLVLLRDQDFFGKKLGRTLSKAKESGQLVDRVKPFVFSDLKPGDNVIHIEHGVAVYEGLKVMTVSGIQAEFLQLRYKDNDRLYLPIYRISQVQKFNGIAVVDKLGGTAWAKTKIRVKSHLKDIASELLQLYAQRSLVRRPAFSIPDEQYRMFEAYFPYDETEDQLNAIDDVMSDLTSDKPMDRLICGDVGFGKTEVAMRAAFKAFEDKKQVAVLAPTTVLVFQHLELFRKRFQKWNAKVVGLSRFTTKQDMTRNLAGLTTGEVDIVIGTHRLLSKDVTFKDLGLMIVDEEQKFGVVHKEKIKKMRIAIDTLTLSATPIPRTLNMSLMGVRDLSIINTAPRERLPIRTFVSKFDEDVIRKAILGEIQRGGQVFFVHNRVQDIEEFSARIREIVPEARLMIGHGQMPEEQLEKTMLAFYKHEFDVLLSTTIIESGLDIPRANTMIIDRADTFGLSQLYQLRGRIGRSNERAYCYLLIPKSGAVEPMAQERLKLIQEHSTLGSGFRIANHDLELRGAGNILGDAQSGFIDAVGHELYLELLEDALRTAKGEEPAHDTIEPDINVRIAALIPDSYIPDIRIRLSYYKMLSDVRSTADLDRIEDDLRDQFGAPPEQVLNLMGIMLIRRHCKELGVRDLSSAPKSISFAFTERTRLKPEVVVKLAIHQPKKFSITPDNRLIVRLEQITWPTIYDEITGLMKLAGLSYS